MVPYGLPGVPGPPYHDLLTQISTTLFLHQGTIASRMSHSCDPNCQATVTACDGRLTIAMRTIRPVHEGEELTFDYASVTESEREFHDAICLCSSPACRGSYLYFTGAKAFQTVLAARHGFLRRQALVLKAGCEPLTDDDVARLMVSVHGRGFKEGERYLRRIAQHCR